MQRGGLTGTNGQGIPGISTRHDTSWMAYPKTTDQKVGSSNLPGRAIASTDYHDTPLMLASGNVSFLHPVAVHRNRALSACLGLVCPRGHTRAHELCGGKCENGSIAAGT